MRQGSTVAALASARGQVGRSGRGIRIDMRLAIALPAALALMTGACGNRDGAPATAAVTPLTGEMTRTLVQEVQGQESLMLAGAGVDCVRVQGVETTTTIGPPGIAVPALVTIWYCPELRAVGRVLVAVPMAPVVTHTLVGHRRAG